MLTEICQYLRNWFEREIIASEFTVSGGVLARADGVALPLLPGQYYRIIGSVFNDGVHRYGVEEVEENNTLVEKLYETLTDEPEFFGAVWTMAVPSVIAELDGEIASWVAENADVLSSPFQSESFGGYSYSLKSGGGGEEGTNGVSWQTQFASKLAPWRKI